MHIFQKLKLSTIPVSFVFLLLSQSFAGCSSHDHDQLHQATYHNTVKHNVNKVSAEKAFDITLHGILLWASIGFLMPIGILTIRMSKEEVGRTRLKCLFYIHALLQTIAVLLATTGAILSIKNFENSFDNTHQRIGLALYGAIWLQAMAGFRRRKRHIYGVLWHTFQYDPI